MFPTCSEILEVVRSLGYIKLSDEEQQILTSIAAVETELAESTQTPDADEEPMESQIENEDAFA